MNERLRQLLFVCALPALLHALAGSGLAQDRSEEAGIRVGGVDGGSAPVVDVRSFVDAEDRVRLLEHALSAYRALEEAGGWSEVPNGPNLRWGDRGERVRAVRQRLTRSWDLAPTPADDDALFDQVLDDAVRRFQERHGLETDGIVGPRTRTAMNVPVEERIRQLVINLERIRAVPDSLGSRYAVINVPGFRLQVIEEGVAVLESKVIVGKPSTPTPLFSTEIVQVVPAPYWYVPASIARNEILPRLNGDPGYLERNGIRRLGGGTLRQDPGPRNPLGRLKFTIPNPHGVGLHDTSEPWLFARSERAFSHGCIRLEKPIEMALYVLRGTEWTRAEIERAIDTWQQRVIQVPDPLPIYVYYWTAWVEPDGTVHFRSDIYGRDAERYRGLVDRGNSTGIQPHVC